MPKSQTVYDVVYSWKRSPEVWGYMAKIAFVSFLVGATAVIIFLHPEKPATGKADQAKVCGSAQGK